LSPYLALLLGVACAGLGGDLFVRGVVAFSRRARVSAGIIGATLAAFATSSPELSVAIGSASAGSPEISLGDVLGSNVVNVALVLGVAVAISAIHPGWSSLRRDFPVAVVAPLLLGVLMLDGRLSRGEAALLLTVFGGWLWVSLREAVRQRRGSRHEGPVPGLGRIAAEGLGGLALLIVAGRLIVIGARGIAVELGIDEFVIGATAVAVGTSVPELATVTVAQLRGHAEVSLGTVLGSNIFNTLFIVGVAGAIHPISVTLGAFAPGPSLRHGHARGELAFAVRLDRKAARGPPARPVRGVRRRHALGRRLGRVRGGVGPRG
jgi:cation:H+ antiporter